MRCYHQPCAFSRLGPVDWPFRSEALRAEYLACLVGRRNAPSNERKALNNIVCVPGYLDKKSALAWADPCAMQEVRYVPSLVAWDYDSRDYLVIINI